MQNPRHILLGTVTVSLPRTIVRKLVTVSRMAGMQEGRIGLLESTESGRWGLDSRKQEGL